MSTVLDTVAADRLGALIQRKGRKAHVASLMAGATSWVTICDRDVPADDRTGLWDGEESSICVHCWRMTAAASLALHAARRDDAALIARLRAELEQRDAVDLGRPFSLEEAAA